MGVISSEITIYHRLGETKELADELLVVFKRAELTLESYSIVDINKLLVHNFFASSDVL